MSQPRIPSIDPADLTEVTGGRQASAQMSSSANSALTTALANIASSIKGIAAQKSNNSGTSGIAQMLPFLALGGGKCPCGCGMANCMRR